MISLMYARSNPAWLIPRPLGLTRALATPKVESGSAFTRSWCSWVRLSLIGWLADERPVRIGDNVDHIVSLFDAAPSKVSRLRTRWRGQTPWMRHVLEQINGCLNRMTFLHRVPAKGTGDGIPDADAARVA
jgi:hypothetical protein